MNQVKQLSQNKFSVKNFLLLGTVVCLVITAKIMPYLLGVSGWEIPVDQSWSYFWNFSPLLPLAIVAGATLARKWAVMLAVCTWLAGDVAIWLITGDVKNGFYPMQPAIYSLMLLTVFVGAAGVRFGGEGTQAYQTVRNLLSGAVGATLYFLLSNFLVWALGSSAPYPHTLSGLIECYTMAVPFYRNSLIGIAVYVPILTGLMHSLAPASELASAHGVKLTENI
ncbi:MAG: hypothetical protein JKY95_05735 [Planctomycetaceae bacterium]|nr:hypothetical protein [Planctomycetaceae bacterium]